MYYVIQDIQYKYNYSIVGNKKPTVFNHFTLPNCRGMVALRRPPDLPVKKKLSWKEGFAQVALGFARALGLGQKEEQGYYAKHRCACQDLKR
jgi:hypothetical protein